jgi:hypothetical protein
MLFWLNATMQTLLSFADHLLINARCIVYDLRLKSHRYTQFATNTWRQTSWKQACYSLARQGPKFLLVELFRDITVDLLRSFIGF